MTTYTGWTIRAGFLAGNLAEGDGPEKYAAALEEALEAEFPGAEIRTPWQNASGCTPSTLSYAAWDADGEERPDEAETVRRIAEDVFNDDAWRDIPADA